MPFPSGIVIEGVKYPIKKGNNAFSIDHQPTVVQQADLAGSSRPSKTARPDTLSWRWDDWSGGEGQTWVTPDVVFAEISVGGQTDSFKKYLSSDLAVDVSVPGQVALGLVATSESTSIGTVAGSTGPHLTVLTENPWVVWDTSAKERTAANTWTARTTNANASSSAHRSVSSGTNVYIGYRGVSGIQYLNSTTPGASFSAMQSESLRLVAGRMYALRPTSPYVYLNRTADLTAVATMTTVGSTQEYTSEGGMTNIGQTIYFVLTANGQSPAIYQYDGNAMSVFATLPSGFRIWQTTSGENEYAICQQNGVLFVGGYYPGVSVNTAAVHYFIPGGSSGVIGKIREGTSLKVTCLYPDKNNGILIGTDNGQVWRYDMGSGGLSLFMSGQSAAALGGGRLNCFEFAGGLYYAAMRDGADTGSVYTTNVGTYPDETIITGSKWDYLFPEEEKSFLSCTITASIPSGCTVKFAFKMDDGALVTTDASGAAMSMTNSDGTSKTFTISNAGTERIFKILQPYLYLDSNTAGDKKSTPTVYSVLMKATTTGKQKFLNCTIDLSNQADANRPTGSNLTGSKLGQTLETLIENSANRFLTVQVPYEKADLPYPRAEDSYVCTIHQSHIEYQNPGQGFAQLVLRIVP